jgi:hypothetical protein
MKALLIVTAAAETATGLGLAGLPALVVSLLLGGTLDTPAALVVARMTGAAMMSLAIACWLARNDAGSRAARGLIGALLFYNAAAVVVLMYAGAGLGLHGILLWPTAVYHVVMAGWCIGTAMKAKGEAR